jgi:hypothetical protein
LVRIRDKELQQSINQSINQASKARQGKQAKHSPPNIFHKKLASKLLDLHFHEVFSRGSYEY